MPVIGLVVCSDFLQSEGKSPGWGGGWEAGNNGKVEYVYEFLC